MNIQITKEMALASLRPAVDERKGLKAPTEAEITAEKLRLEQVGDNEKLKHLKRSAHTVDIFDLLESIEELSTQLNALSSRVAVLERKPK